MPSFNSKVQLSTAAQNSNTVLSDVDRIKGAFKVYTADEMNSAHVNYFTDGQIIYVSDSGSLYRANVTLTDPALNIFEDSVTFSEFSFDSGSFTSASFDSDNSTLTFFGPDLSGSAQVSMSVDLSDLSGGGGSTDISDLNTFTGSAETRLDDLEAATGSYLVTGSVSENIITLEKADGSSFTLTVDTGSGVSTDISDLNTFTGSAETRLDDLEAATGSYITNAQTGSFLVPSDTGSLLITGSVSSNVITLEKGDGTSFTLTVDTGSGGGASVGTLQQVTEQGNDTTLPISIQKIKIQSGLGWNREDALSSSLFIGENIAPVAINVASQSSLAQYELNTFIGGNAGQHVTEFLRANTVIGTEAALGESGITNNLGASNTIVGAQAMYTYQRGGGGNTVIGASAFNNFKSGSDNIVIGRGAAYQANSGSHNIYIGVNTGPFNGKLAENEIVIGTDPYSGSGGLRGHGSNTVTLGNTSTTDNYFYGDVHYTGSLIPEATDDGNGIHDLGTQANPWRELFITTASIKFIQNGEIFSTVSGERDAIRVGNVLITTASLAFVNNQGDIVSNIATAQESGSDVVGGTTTETGSLLTTGSVAGNVLTFTKGDGTTFNLTVDTGSGSGTGDITAVLAGDGLSGGASSGDATLALDTGSAHFIDAVLGSGLFRLTGSVYATTNDVAITGSLDVNFVESTQEFRVSSQSVTQFSINNEGVAVLAPRSTVPTAVSGGMYFSTDGNFYFGIQQ